jgi:hypothetical protein
MNVVKGFPPNYKSIESRFHPDEFAIFTYGSTIYTPHIDFQLPEHLFVHEEVHEKQQGNDPESWWERYLIDESFRFNQELSAYKAQYNFLCKGIDRNSAFMYAHRLAQDFSSSMYGNIIDYHKALKLIQS